MWDFSRYNVVVKQVEGCSDLLRDVEARIRPLVGDDRIAQGLLRNLAAAIVDLDVRAIKMLALYDPAARLMRAKGVKYDERRDMFGESFRARADRAIALIPPPAPDPPATVKRGKRRRRRSRREEV